MNSSEMLELLQLGKDAELKARMTTELATEIALKYQQKMMSIRQLQQQQTKSS